MTREEIDKLWFKAMHESIKDGEDFIRYHFAALVVAAETERLEKLCYDYLGQLTALRAEKQMSATIRERAKT